VIVGNAASRELVNTSLSYHGDILRDQRQATVNAPPSTQTVKLIEAQTSNLPPREKFSYWNEVICRTVVDLDCQPIAHENFEASIAGFDAPGLGVYHIHTQPHLVYRRASEISRVDSDAIILNLVTSGSLLSEQDGRSVTLKCGDGAISDAARPYFLRFDDPLGCVSIKINKSDLGLPVSVFERLTAKSMASLSGLNTMLFEYMSALLKNVATMDPASAQKATDIFKQLLCASIDGMQSNTHLPLSEYRALSLLRAKHFIAAHLHLSELDAAYLSSALGLSVRYLNKLFEAEQTSLMRYVWGQRLERCAGQLNDARSAHLSISTIALRWGFNDLSHFSRVFGAKYEMSPRAFRAQALAAKNAL
jgi:AraC family transcriptional regulator, positive regulator of tynA and feaB